MGHGAYVVFTKTISTDGSITGEYDLGRSWENVYLSVPTMTAAISTSTCNVFIKAAAETGGDFFDVVHPMLNTSTTGINTFTIANSVSQAVLPIPNAFRFVKVQVGNTATAAVAFKVICSD